MSQFKPDRQRLEGDFVQLKCPSISPEKKQLICAEIKAKQGLKSIKGTKETPKETTEKSPAGSSHGAVCNGKINRPDTIL